MVPTQIEGSRPRVEGEREQEILSATLTILRDQGYDRLTMDAVAQQAKASKATLYRRWRSKPALVVEAIRRVKGDDPVTPDTGSLRGDLLASFCGPSGMAYDDEMTSLMASVITAAHTDPEFAAEFRTEFLHPKIVRNQEIYERARARGEVSADCDVALLGPVLPAVLLHRAFIFGEPITHDLVARVIDQVVLPAARGDR